jgi:hypothetical protein
LPCPFWAEQPGSYGPLQGNFFSRYKKRFNPETDILIFMCRSGGRSCDSADIAVSQANWPADKIYSMMGGFEGDKMKNEFSAFNGKRVLGGWKNEGLPWTYKVDPKFAYPEAD